MTFYRCYQFEIEYSLLLFIKIFLHVFFITNFVSLKVGAIQIDLFHQFLCSEKVSQAKVWTTRELQDIEGFSAQNVR